MDSSFPPGWLGSKLNINENSSRGNVATSLQWRQLGMNSKGSAFNSQILKETAEDHLVNKAHLSERCCELPGVPKSTFLMVFSPDGTKVASTHGNHKIYVCELSSGKHVKTLSGHPRTPWCIAFHPSHPKLLGSGCLGGQVRVWDLSGGSEVWTVGGKTVIASIAFHPRDRLLVIATYNELYFWDWVYPQPFTKVQTNTIKEKVRFVSFDPLGHKLITGISVWALPDAPSTLQQPTPGGSSPHHPTHGSSPNLPHEHISTYHNLLQRYDTLVRNYRHLFMARTQLNTTDRGTDPMEIDPSGQPSTSSSTVRPPTTEGSSQPSSSGATPRPFIGRQQRSQRRRGSNPDQSDSDDETSAGTGGPLNLDVQSISLGNTPVTRNCSHTRREIPMSDTMTFVTTSVPRVSYMAIPRETLFGSGSSQSAFRPLSEANNTHRAAEIPDTSLPIQPDRPSRENSTPTEEVPVSTSATTDTAQKADPPSTSNSNIRHELNRLQGIMENSLDETLNSLERNGSLPVRAIQSTVSALREFTLQRNPTNASSRRLYMTPPTNSFVRNPQVYSHGSRPTVDCSYTTSHGSRLQRRLNRNSETTESPERSTSQPGNRRQNSSQNSNIEQRFDTIGNMMRDSRMRLLNLINEFTEFSAIRQILQDYQQQRNRQAPNRPDGMRERSDSLYDIPSSDDGSDNDMFSPLPLHVYGGRFWNLSNSPPPAHASSFGNVFEPTQTSSISMHIDDEDRHFRRQLLPNSEERELLAGLEQGRNLPFPSRLVNLSLRHIVSRNAVLLNIDSNRQNQPGQRQPSQPPAQPEQPPPSATEQVVQEERHPIAANRPLQRRSQHLLRRLAQLPIQRTRTSSAPTPDRSHTESDGNSSFVCMSRGVQAIQRHTESLVGLCSTNASSPPLRQLRQMWEDLRRAIVSIHNSFIPGHGPAISFSLSAQTRCRLLNFMSTSFPDPNRSSRHRSPNLSSSSRAHTPRQSTSRGSDTTTPSENTLETASGNSQSNDGISSSTSNPQPSTSGSRIPRPNRSRHLKAYPSSSRLRTASLGFLPQDLNQSMRRRIRSLVLNRIRQTTLQRSHLNRGQRRSLRNRSPFHRELEISRETIRFHAGRVVALMFNIMMQCRQASQVGNLITVMLGSLKKALGLTLLLMSQPFSNESLLSLAPILQSNRSTTRENQLPIVNSTDRTTELLGTNRVVVSDSSMIELSTDPNPFSWIETGIAIQISAVNRNNSSKAKKRKERYNLFKRNQALRNRNQSHSIKNTSPRKTSPKENFTNSTNERPVEDDPVPSTSGLQRHNNVPTSASSIPDVIPSTSGSSTNTNDRRVYSRMLFRRYLYNYGFMRDIVGVIRSENLRNQPPSNAESPTFRPAYRPRIFSVRGSSTTRSESVNQSAIIDSFNSNVVVPIVRVNDVPVSEVQQPPRTNNAFPQPSLFSREQPVIPQNIMSVDENGGAGILESGPSLIAETPESPVHRIQVWDFTQGQLPNICNTNINVVVQKCKIHNDASIDISRDGRLLVALLPAQRMRNITHRLGIYSLEWGCLGQCLYTALLEQNAVSISLSPCARHLAVGLGSRRVSLQPYGRNGIMALIFRLGPLEKHDNNDRRGCLIPIRSLDQSWEQGFTSLNCLRWAPQPGQGLVYANNTGQLKILS